MDLKLQHLDFWASLHGQVPGLLDWDMGNESFLAFTTTHLPLAEQNRECPRGGSWGMGAPRRVGGSWARRAGSSPAFDLLATRSREPRAFVAFGAPRPLC